MFVVKGPLHSLPPGPIILESCYIILSTALGGERCLALVLSQPINLWGNLGKKCGFVSSWYHQPNPNPRARYNECMRALISSGWFI